MIVNASSTLLQRILEKLLPISEVEAHQIASILRKHGVEKGLVLDAGCGIGRIAIHLAEMGYEVVCLDIEPNLVSYAHRLSRERSPNQLLHPLVADGRFLHGVFRSNSFDAVLFYWGSVFGLYDRETDREILCRSYEVSKRGAKLFILRYYDKIRLQLLHGLLGYGPLYWINDFGDSMTIEEHRYDYVQGVVRTTIKVFEKHGDYLRYLGNVEVSINVYSIDELIRIASSCGWELEEVYGSLANALPYDSMPLPLNLNAVFTKR